MGSSQQPLLGGEDLHLSPSEKDQILHKINRQWNLKFVMPVFIVFTVCGCIGIFLTANILKNDQILISLSGLALVALAYGIASWVWMKNDAREKAAAAQLFEEQYIGAWRFEPHMWRDFARYLFEQKSMQTWIMVAMSVFVLAGGIISFIAIAATNHTLSVGVIFCITMIVSLVKFTLFAGLVGGQAFYPRYRSYSPTVHCCVLGRGSIYLLGTMYILQPAAARSASMVYNLISVTLEEKMIETNMTKILRFDTITQAKKDAVKLEVPVPDQFVQNVGRWMYTLAEGYTEDVTNTLEGAAMKGEVVPQAVATTYVTENDITP
ncbi:hypothetical protein PROFUN_02355 [Planoprotostelium fungivorum]|uniref:Uncharacterized protein n=1 Tax=Planoprotostelium fungivorum TaxID=1890364 RepID=A0A2P6NUK9_9EUKA|nr:hypothetical protein PROFUN_02355 [Planoprotostelium fungivorum]